MSAIKKYDIAVLLTVLLIFSYGLTLFYARTSGEESLQKEESTVEQQELAGAKKTRLIDRDIMGEIQEFVMAQDVRRIAEVLSTAPAVQQRQVLSYLVTTAKNNLTLQEKITLILMVAFTEPDESAKKNILTLLTDKKIDIERIAPVYLIYKNLLENLMPSLFALLKTMNQKRTWIFQGAYYAIHQNNAAVLARIVSNHGQILTAYDLNALLFHAIEYKKSTPKIIELLISAGADPNAVRNGKTPLIEAVLAATKDTQENAKLVIESLIKKGAVVNKIADPAVGSALQVAIRKGYTPIELALREHGARE